MAEGGFDQLTERERRVLRLLASGHSVKSAAVEEAITENAANELLRSARRKLGTGSSREAARLLAEHEGGSQKNRDEISVIPVTRSSGQASARLNKGAIAMGLAALTATAVLIIALQGGGSGIGTPAAEPLQGSRIMPVETPKESVPAGAPEVIGTVPAQGAEIEPGPFQVAVTFDRPMAPNSYAISRSDEGAHPECAGPPRLSADGRTYSLSCVASPGARYVMHFNRPPYIGFVDAETKTPAQEARLEFTVAGDAAAAAPKVVSTSPVEGAAIAQGPFTLSVTFDRPMLPQAMSVVRTDEGAFPECAGLPQLSEDGRTYAMECIATAPGTYVIYFNRPPYMNFRDARTQVSAAPARLEFTVLGD